MSEYAHLDDQPPAEPTWLELGIMCTFVVGGYGVAFGAIFAAIAVLGGLL